MTTSTLLPTSTRYAVSADGTQIAYEVSGSGPALVIVDGAMCDRGIGSVRNLAKPLSDAFTVYAYDRRGRNESGAGETDWTVEREFEDLQAVIDAAGGTAHVLGISSGAAIALDAAQHGVTIEKLAVFEAPLIVDETHAPFPLDEHVRYAELVAEGRRGEAIKRFMRMVGVPAPFVGLMRVMPAWKKMVANAHTLPWDLSVVGPHRTGDPLPEGRYAGIDVPTLVIEGGKSPEFMRNSQAAIAAAVPGARLESLPGQTHMVKPKAIAPVLTAFYEDQ